MIVDVTLDEFEGETSSGKSHSVAPEDRLLSPISPSVGLRLIPGRGDPLYLQNRGTERYLVRDEHDRWFILQPSAKDSEEAFVRWVYLPEDKPERLARSALRRRTVIGYDYVRRSAAPDPVRSTVTAMFVTERWPETMPSIAGMLIPGYRILIRCAGDISPTSEFESQSKVSRPFR